MRRLVYLAVFFTLPAALGAQPTPQGADFQVNTVGDYVYYPSVAFGGDGRFVVVWTNYIDPDYEVAGRRYQADGSPIGDEFQIDVSATYPYDTDVEFAADDSFMVVWDDYGADLEARARVFASDGSPTGGEIAVNVWTTGNQGTPKVARAGNRFVVVWQSADQDGDFEGIFGRLFDSAGSAIGGEFQVNTYTTNAQTYASVAAAPDGRFVVAWLQGDVSESNEEVFVRRYASDGAPAGAPIAVGATGEPASPSIAVGSDGRFIVAFTMEPSTESSVDAPGKVLPVSEGVYAQRFQSDGSLNGGLFTVQTTNVAPFDDAEVSMDPSDRFLITWGSGEAVRGQRYSSSAVPVGGEFQITSSGAGSTSAVDPTSDGFVVVWTNTGQTVVNGQLYSGLLPVELVEFSID